MTLYKVLYNGTLVSYHPSTREANRYVVHVCTGHWPPVGDPGAPALSTGYAIVPFQFKNDAGVIASLLREALAS